jgi:ABC-2 type transport system ATP-binding protein
MLDDGRIIYDGGLDELKNRWSKGREIQFQFAGHTALAKLQQLTETLAVTWTMENEVTAKMWLPHAVNVSDALACVVGGVEIRDIKIIETNTDDIVRSIYSSGSAVAAKETAKP